MTKNTSSQKIAVLILCFLLFEGGIFAYTATTYITPFYPRFFDQIQYLRESYLAYQEMQLNGLWSAIYTSLSNQVAQGVWHDFAALLSMSVFGPHRISALLVNFIWLIFFQLALFFVTLSATRNTSVAWLSFLMPLLIQGIWRPDVGGALYDFRLDHLAMCMMGLTIISCLKTEGFTNRKWSIIFGLLVSLTITGRFLTSVYFGLIFALLFITLLFMTNKRDRISNLIISVITATPLVIIFFYRNWIRIFDYYLTGHVTGEEKIARASGLNIYQTFEYIVVNGLWTFQGAVLYLYCIFIPILYFLITKKSLRTMGEIFSQLPYSWWRTVGLIFLISPILVLSLESETQNAVLSIISPGVVIFFLSLLVPCYLETEKIKPMLTRILAIPLTIFATLCLTYSNFTFKSFDDFKKNADKVNEITDFIYDYSKNTNHRTKIATNRIVEFLDANILTTSIYERHGEWISLEGALPIGNLKAKTTEILTRLRESDLVFSIEEPSISRGFPSELQMQDLQNKFQEIYQEQFKVISKIEVFGKKITIYQRDK